VAALVKLSSRGDVFYRQERMGLDGKPFMIYKFRSMYDDAEAETGPVFASEQDPRRTPLGKLLRRSNVDELPQLWNVLRGDMSLVGPRPPLPCEVDGYETHARRRLLIKPGITGLWQVNGRSNLDWDESVRLDLYYVENWSLTGDIMILWRTAKIVLKPVGAY